MKTAFFALPAFCLAGPAFAGETLGQAAAFSPWGWAVLAVFAAAYLLVFAEERLHLRKSKPVMIAGGVIWIIVAMAYERQGRAHEAAELLRHNVLEYAELLLFLLAAMSYVNTMVERGVFDKLRAGLVGARLSLRGLFWVTGALAFVMSPIADNLTTALVMGTVAIALGKGHRGFVAAACVNIVVAANAGGAFSPFGDITTLMIWQHGAVGFGTFFHLLLPSLVGWLVPAACLAISLPPGHPEAPAERARIKRGGGAVVVLFLLTLAGTVFLHHTLELPPFFGMMLGLAALKLYGFFLRRREERVAAAEIGQAATRVAMPHEKKGKPFDTFDSLREVEWDTLLFFYGIILCVGGLGAMGHLALLSQALYGDWGPTVANTAIGVLSAVVDNIPLTFAVLSMNPAMDTGQWLLLTLAAGTGGSLLSIGSAAGVALMGIGKGGYGFGSHLKWSWAILLGYAASILVHKTLNEGFFTGVN